MINEMSYWSGMDSLSISFLLIRIEFRPRSKSSIRRAEPPIRSRSLNRREARRKYAGKHANQGAGGGLPTPPTAPIDEDRRIELFGELSTLLGKTHRFEQFSDSNVWDEALYLVKYRTFSIDIIRRANAQARKYISEYLRGKDDLALDQIGFLMAPAQHIQPDGHAASVREKHVRFTLADIRKALESFPPSISGISGIIRPDQDMVDWIMREIAKARHKVPPYEPYLVIKLDTAPWSPPQGGSFDRPSFMESAARTIQARHSAA